MKTCFHLAGAYATIILFFVVNCVISQDMQIVVLGRSANHSVTNAVTFKVDLEWNNTLTPSEQPTIIIETSLHDNYQPSAAVNFVVLYGHNSEYWKQTTKGGSKITLCIDHTELTDFPTSLIITAQNDPQVSEVGINIMVRKQPILSILS